MAPVTRQKSPSRAPAAKRRSAPTRSSACQTPGTAVYDPGLVDAEHVALAGFLGGDRGLTRDAYALDLRQFVAFCEKGQRTYSSSVAATSRPFGRALEARSRPRSPWPTVGGGRPALSASCCQLGRIPARFDRLGRECVAKASLPVACRLESKRRLAFGSEPSLTGTAWTASREDSTRGSEHSPSRTPVPRAGRKRCLRPYLDNG